MSSVLVDTCVFSYIYRGDTRAETYQRHLDGKIACLSFMSVAELYRWSLARKWGRAKLDALRDRIGDFLVLPYDDRIGWQWASLMTLKGVPLNPSDAWIAACAVCHGLPLVTHNRKDFERIPGLVLISDQSHR